MPGRRASQRDRHEHMLLVECETPDCHRMFCSSKHTRCCSNCGALALNGEWSHTGRCQKQQRHLGRRGLAFVSGAMTSCSTDGCGRLHTPGYRACCSRCANFRGTRHSRRCDDMHRRSGGALVATPAAPESNTVVPNRGTDSWPGASMASMAALAPASSSSSATASASALASASLASAGVPHGGMSFYPEMGLQPCRLAVQCSMRRCGWLKDWRGTESLHLLPNRCTVWSQNFWCLEWPNALLIVLLVVLIF